jgi:hypothetical protein
VYDSASKLPRNEYMKIVMEKEPWIFSSKLIRERIEKRI